LCPKNLTKTERICEKNSQRVKTTSIEVKNKEFEEKKSARTSQKEEEVGELPRATEDTGGRRSFHLSKRPQARIK